MDVLVGIEPTIFAVKVRRVTIPPQDNVFIKLYGFGGGTRTHIILGYEPSV